MNGDFVLNFIFCACILFFGAVFVFVSCQDMNYEQEVKSNHVTVSAYVESVSSGANTPEGKLYTVRVSYQYNGQEYKATLHFDSGSESIPRKGKTITCYIDPNNPSKAYKK